MTHDSVSINYDMIIVGAGPAGLSAAIQYAQQCKKANRDFSVCVLEKGSEVGSHILSGAAIDPCALNELIPDWQQRGAPLETQAKADQFLLLTEKKSYAIPTPYPLKNQGNYIGSLGLLCRWLAEYAESIGVEIYTGFAATKILYDENNTVIGIMTDDKGRDKNGDPKPSFQPGMQLLAKQTLLAEGCRGYLSQQVIQRFKLDKNCDPQTYGIGLKEIWEIDPAKHRKGMVMHTIGWPLDTNTYGGSFIYHWGENLLSIGFVIGLDYHNPYLNPFQEFQRFKHHPRIKPLLENGKCLSYGARALNEGGWQSIPRLTFPGGMLIGDCAGFLNVAKIKGTHNAMRSGMLAADTFFESLNKPPTINNELPEFDIKIKKSPIAKELYRARNIRPAFQWGLLKGILYSGIDMYLFGGHAPWTLHHYPKDNESTSLAKNAQIIHYPLPDQKISFDRMTALSLSNVYHEENQPCHLKLKDPKINVEVNWANYAGLEQRYCPAGVYEFIENADSGVRLQINASNCIHCKTCDIKDPMQNIVWTPPEGGGGPNYSIS